MKPRSDLGVFRRGERISTLGVFDLTGFIDWYMITGTFKAVDFLDAVEEVVLLHVNPFPGPRSVVILDNATVHKRQSFVDAIHAKGAIVLWTPPYCWHLNPIEEGFGCVRQRLMRNKHLLSWPGTGGMRGLLAMAFASVSPARARSCYHHVGYL